MTPSPTPPRASARVLAALLLVALALIVPASANASAWVAQQSVPIVNARTTQPAVPQIGVDAAGNAVMAMVVAPAIALAGI